MTPLHLAAERGDEAEMQQLLEKEVDIETEDMEGRTALYMAARGGYEAVVWMLLEKRANAEARTRDGRTPLYAAALGGYEALARMLVKKGADVNVETADGWTALHIAAYRGYKSIAQMLVWAGANVKAKNTDGRTALQVAYEKRHEAVVRVLVENEANNTTSLPPPKTNSDPQFLASRGNITNSQKWLERIDQINGCISAAAIGHPNTQVVKIAILDTGCDLEADHFTSRPTDEARLTGHWRDFVGSSIEPIDMDKGRHGTALATLLFRVALNAEIFVARVAENAVGLDQAKDHIAEAIRYAAAEWRVDIVSMSFGFAHEVKSITDAIGEAIRVKKDRIIFFAAAANDGSNSEEMFPASLENVISVRGTDHVGSFVPEFNPPTWPNNEGSKLYGTLGQNVPYDWADDSLTMSGCSLATPILAGITALIVQYVSQNATTGVNVQRLIRTRNGILQVFRQIAVNHAQNRSYVAPWFFFNKDESLSTT
ncbi:hypothetical protein GP486_003622 [Trichoglossum hirsutum]|uniref:Peptidase S8/S53 domain-containing protein n=1 Tax=Trichoglossum hirsutum TaxID=265104 RepID=A0A9P8LCP8_9PEZI|nr:hypothetical protein GP486_003622 [Trichoglossum hirsutum]